MKGITKQTALQAVVAGLALALVAVEPARGGQHRRRTRRAGRGSIIEPLLLICAAVMGFGAMLKGDWKTLGGCILMLLIVGSMLYGHRRLGDADQELRRGHRLMADGTAGEQVVHIRSFRNCFTVERRIHKLDRWRVPLPYGLPVRGPGVLRRGAALALLVLSRLPLFGELLQELNTFTRLVLVPGAIAFVLYRVTLDGRPSHAAAVAWVRMRMGARAHVRVPAAGRAGAGDARQHPAGARRALGADARRGDRGAGRGGAAVRRRGADPRRRAAC